MAGTDINKAYLAKLIKQRARAGRAYTRRAYLQGRIDEFCSQNAISQSDYPKLDLRLS